MAMINKRNLFNGVIALSSLWLVFLIYQCKNPKIVSEYSEAAVLATHATGANFVGSNTCLECHEDIYKSHLNTAHFNTSALADSTNIKGSFAPGLNQLDLESVRFTMFRDGDVSYQKSEIKNRLVKNHPEKFDVVIGSGVRGQSYLTWKDSALFQLQTSYYKPANQWVKSPGFPSYKSDRPIRAACLKCHMTFAASSNFLMHDNNFDKEKMLFGIDCERCHRPAQKHVMYHRENPSVNKPMFIMKYDTLSRQQQLDACAQCHSGARDHIIKGNSFSFLAGENLNEYAQNIESVKPEKNLEVHGNQYGLLVQSNCFKKSTTMTCSSCHDPHKNQRNDAVYFNQKCVSCHQVNKKFCTVKTNGNGEMNDNCITCHMPISPSKIMSVQLTTDSLETSFYIRSHLIGVYD